MGFELKNIISIKDFKKKDIEYILKLSKKWNPLLSLKRNPTSWMDLY